MTLLDFVGLFVVLLAVRVVGDFVWARGLRALAPKLMQSILGAMRGASSCDTPPVGVALPPDSGPRLGLACLNGVHETCSGFMGLCECDCHSPVETKG